MVRKTLSDESPRPLCPPLLQFFTIDKSLWITAHNCRSYIHPQLLKCFTKYFVLLIDLPIILCNLLLLKLLTACTMANSICPVIFVDILCHYHLESPDLIHLRMLTIINPFLEFILTAQISFWTWTGSRQIKPWLIVHLILFNLLSFRSERLLLIPRFGNCKPFVFKLRLIQMFHKPMHLHPFFFCLSTDTHTRFIATTWSFGGLLSDSPFVY